MTIPKIVVTLEGGLVQSILVSHQAEVYVLDYDVEGADSNSLILVNGQRCSLSYSGLYCPGEDDELLSHMLKCIEKGETP